MISVITPTYNEKENICVLIKEIHSALKEYPHEIVVVDDNSPDGTFGVIKDLEDERVKVILRRKDKGLGYSIRCGLEQARGDIFVIMDSDFNHNPRYLVPMVQSVGQYDCVLASRFVRGGRMTPFVRHVLSSWFNQLIRLLTGMTVSDSLYGYFAVKREIIEQCPYDQVFWGYGDYCIRLMYYLQRADVRILEFPALHGKRRAGRGNRRLVQVFCQYLYEVFKLAYLLRKKRSKCKAVSYAETFNT